jgi:uncharacterized protein (TIGR00290 family)
MAPEKAWLAWSSGKDSAWALHVARQYSAIEVVGLLTTVTEGFARATMHGVREELVEAQADAVGLPLHRARIPQNCSDETYAAIFRPILENAKAGGVRCVLFGDLFLADVRAYREAQMAKVGMAARFPLWGRETDALAREMIDGGLRAWLTCVDPKQIRRDLIGAAFDDALLAALPAEADRCGENGEFHTFAWDGPMFRHPIAVERGSTVERGGFVFKDLIASRGDGLR